MSGTPVLVAPDGPVALFVRNGRIPEDRYSKAAVAQTARAERVLRA